MLSNEPYVSEHDEVAYRKMIGAAKPSIDDWLSPNNVKFQEHKTKKKFNERLQEEKLLERANVSIAARLSSTHTVYPRFEIMKDAQHMVQQSERSHACRDGTRIIELRRLEKDNADLQKHIDKASANYDRNAMTKDLAFCYKNVEHKRKLNDRTKAFEEGQLARENKEVAKRLEKVASAYSADAIKADADRMFKAEVQKKSVNAKCKELEGRILQRENEAIANNIATAKSSLTRNNVDAAMEKRLQKHKIFCEQRTRDTRQREQHFIDRDNADINKRLINAKTNYSARDFIDYYTSARAKATKSARFPKQEYIEFERQRVKAENAKRREEARERKMKLERLRNKRAQQPKANVVHSARDDDTMADVTQSLPREQYNRRLSTTSDKVLSSTTRVTPKERRRSKDAKSNMSRQSTNSKPVAADSIKAIATAVMSTESRPPVENSVGDPPGEVVADIASKDDVAEEDILPPDVDATVPRENASLPGDDVILPCDDSKVDETNNANIIGNVGSIKESIGKNVDVVTSTEYINSTAGDLVDTVTFADSCHSCVGKCAKEATHNTQSDDSENIAAYERDNIPTDEVNDGNDDETVEVQLGNFESTVNKLTDNINIETENNNIPNGEVDATVEQGDTQEKCDDSFIDESYIDKDKSGFKVQADADDVGLSECDAVNNNRDVVSDTYAIINETEDVLSKEAGGVLEKLSNFDDKVIVSELNIEEKESILRLPNDNDDNGSSYKYEISERSLSPKDETSECSFSENSDKMEDTVYEFVMRTPDDDESNVDLYELNDCAAEYTIVDDVITGENSYYYGNRESVDSNIIINEEEGERYILVKSKNTYTDENSDTIDGGIVSNGGENQAGDEQDKDEIKDCKVSLTVKSSSIASLAVDSSIVLNSEHNIRQNICDIDTLEENDINTLDKNSEDIPINDLREFSVSNIDDSNTIETEKMYDMSVIIASKSQSGIKLYGSDESEQNNNHKNEVLTLPKLSGSKSCVVRSRKPHTLIKRMTSDISLPMLANCNVINAHKGSGFDIYCD